RRPPPPAGFPPAGPAPTRPARPMGPPPGSRARRPSAGLPGAPGFGAPAFGTPGFGTPLGAPEPLPARSHETARIQVRQRRSWGGVIGTLLVLVAGAAAAVHFY